MNNSDDILIEKFIAGQLSIDEARDFEYRLATDKEFNTNYRATIAANELITEAGRLDLKKKLESFDAETLKNSEEKKIMPLWVKRSLPIAALLVIFFGIYQFGLFNKSMTSSEVYSNNFEVYEAPSALRDVEESSQINWEVGIELYSNMEYDEALERFSNAEENIPEYIVFFYKGVSAMAQGQPNYEIALQNFESVMQSDNDYRQQSKWYKALIMLKTDRREVAFAIFNEIVSAKSFNYKKANRILKTKFKD